MIELLDHSIEVYVQQHTAPESDLLARLSDETERKVLLPRMLSGHVQGRILSMISKMIRPKRILEIGTYTGYSALCMAEGLTDDGELISLDVNEELEDMVRRYWDEAPQGKRMKQLIGKALDVIPTLPGNFDLVFIDADKLNYENYYRLIIDRVPSGGYIIADNVLWSGKVADPSAQDKDTKAMRAFNKMLHEDPRVENTLLAVRDGLLILRKN
jgi:predicted O-methyltransferase YrrM